jgi:hypothetical protein
MLADIIMYQFLRRTPIKQLFDVLRHPNGSANKKKRVVSMRKVNFNFVTRYMRSVYEELSKGTTFVSNISFCDTPFGRVDRQIDRRIDVSLAHIWKDWTNNHNYYKGLHSTDPYLGK